MDISTAEGTKNSEVPADPDVLAAERSSRQPLTRQRIIRAALHIMDEEGLQAVTMRRIGRELGVEAMSLYNHVRDKEEILDAICEEVLTEFEVPDEKEWAPALRAGAKEYRRLLLAHPRVITLMTGRKGPMTNPDSVKVYEFALGLFRDAGMSVADAVKAFNTFGSYILGSVTMELGPMISGTADEVHRRAHEEMGRLAAAAGLPRLAEALPHLVDCDIQGQFEFGLDLLIEAVGARIPAGSNLSPPAAGRRRSVTNSS